MERRLFFLVLLVASLFRFLWLDSLPAVVTNHEAQVAVHAWQSDSLRFWFSGEEVVSPIPWFSAMLSIKLFGLSAFALRLPIALASIASVYLLYFIGKRWFGMRVGFLSAGILAIVPWHIHLSRFFIEESLFVTALLGLVWSVAARSKKLILVGGVVVALSSWHWIDRLATALVTNIQWWFVNLFKYLSFDWLFFRGDKYFLHGIGDLGQFYTILIPFFLIGLFVVWEKKVGKVVLFVSLVFLALASLSRFSPEARASLLVLPWLVMVIAVGIDASWRWAQKGFPRWSRVFVLVVSIVAIYQVISYVHFYTVHFGKRSGSEWPAVYKQVVPYIESVYDQYDQIIVSNHYGSAREQLIFHASENSVLRSDTGDKVRIGTPDNLDGMPPNTLLLLEPAPKLAHGRKIAEFKVANDVTAMVAWETQK